MLLEIREKEPVTTQNIGFLLIAVPAFFSRSDELKVYHCTTGQMNKFTWGQMGELPL